MSHFIRDIFDDNRRSGGSRGFRSTVGRVRGFRRGVTALSTLLFLLAGCDDGLVDDMATQPKKTPYEPSNFFAVGTSARPILPGTVTRDGVATPQPPERIGLFNVRASPPPAEAFPFELTADDVERGCVTYNAICSVCHGQTGDGNGIVVQRGFVRPPSFYEQRLRDVPVGHFYTVITNGYGAMYPYHDRVAEDDRWRIAAYIRALQLSEPATTGGGDE